MALTQVLHSVQYVVNERGERTAALLDIQAWETLVNWIETVVDTMLTGEALAELSAAGGRPGQAGWLAWDAVRDLWDEEEQLADTLLCSSPGVFAGKKLLGSKQPQYHLEVSMSSIS